MADSPEAIHKAVKKIKLIGLVLAIFTILTVLLSWWELPSHSLNIMVGMIVATFKAGLVALIFMHLNHEAKLIYKILAFTLVFALAIFLLIYWTSLDPLRMVGF